MEKKTRVDSIRIKSKPTRLMDMPQNIIKIEPENNWLQKWLSLDRLVRNLAVVGCLVLVAVALKNSTLPQAQSVFGAIQTAAGMEWDESLGKLSFVNTFLPQEIREVWNETSTVEINAPLTGEIVHTWSNVEPYVLIHSNDVTVYAADSGEVMSITHGMDEELIVRVRHESGCETVYGNLSQCAADVGDYVRAGEAVGKLHEDKTLAFELRRSGKSVKPVFSSSFSE